MVGAPLKWYGLMGYPGMNPSMPKCQAAPQMMMVQDAPVKRKPTMKDFFAKLAEAEAILAEMTEAENERGG